VQPHAHWLEAVERVRSRFKGKFTSFSDMSPDQIVTLTGLSHAEAQRAAQREFGEPVHWHGPDTELDAFIQSLLQQGARVLQGGRFLHVSGECNKGAALAWLHGIYRTHAGKNPVLSLAIGDSHNDIAMLEAAEHALVIRSPVHAPPPLRRDRNVTLSTLTGPLGWDEGVRQILKKLSR